MASRLRRPRRLAAAAGGLFLAVLLAGCVSVPTGGPVLSYTITQGQGGQGGQSQPNPQTIAQPPRAIWGPEQIVQGFLTASASFGTRQQIARLYLTADGNHNWNPGWTATVYRNGPDAVETSIGPKKTTATVTISGSVQANLNGSGGYAVPSASTAGGAAQAPTTFDLQKVGGKWRISRAPNFLLLTSYQFKYDYQLRNLYFFDPGNSVLVPDPVYVPLQATAANLMDGLVDDLKNPPGDWLVARTTGSTRSGATKTAFPKGTTRIGDVTLNGGTAAVNLGGAITKADTGTLERVSAQLLWTLTGSGISGSAVQSVELSLNGKLWSPPNSDQNPVQQLRQSNMFSPLTGANSTYYYLDPTGNLQSSTGLQAKPQKQGHIGTGYSSLAVSPDQKYVAAISNGTLFAGRIGHPLAKREGAGYTSISWDRADNLWATMDSMIVMLRGTAQGKPVPVNVVASDGSTPDAEPFSALRVAPDGVRVAIIVGATDLHFGAIVQTSDRPAQLNVEIVLSPFSVSSPGATFTAVTWYGPYNVITLRDPGPELTEYPVDGGNSTSIPAQPRTSWITASYGNPLLAGLPRGAMWADASLSGSWIPARTAISPVYPG